MAASRAVSMETSTVQSTVWYLVYEMVAMKVAMWALQMDVEMVGAKVQPTGGMTVSSLAVCSELDLAVQSGDKSDAKTAAMTAVETAATTGAPTDG